MLRCRRPRRPVVSNLPVSTPLRSHPPPSVQQYRRRRSLLAPLPTRIPSSNQPRSPSSLSNLSSSFVGDDDLIDDVSFLDDDETLSLHSLDSTLSGDTRLGAGPFPTGDGDSILLSGEDDEEENQFVVHHVHVPRIDFDEVPAGVNDRNDFFQDEGVAAVAAGVEEVADESSNGCQYERLSFGGREPSMGEYTGLRDSVWRIFDRVRSCDFERQRREFERTREEDEVEGGSGLDSDSDDVTITRDEFLLFRRLLRVSDLMHSKIRSDCEGLVRPDRRRRERRRPARRFSPIRSPPPQLPSEAQENSLMSRLRARIRHERRDILNEALAIRQSLLRRRRHVPTFGSPESMFGPRLPPVRDGPLRSPPRRSPRRRQGWPERAFPRRQGFASRSRFSSLRSERDTEEIVDLDPLRGGPRFAEQLQSLRDSVRRHLRRANVGPNRDLDRTTTINDLRFGLDPLTTANLDLGYETLLGLDSENVRVGISENARKNRTKVVRWSGNESTQPRDRDVLGSSSSSCAICLSDYTEGDLCRVLLLCSHQFHRDCIDRWLVNHHSCPICKMDLNQ